MNFSPRSPFVFMVLLLSGCAARERLPAAPLPVGSTPTSIAIAVGPCFGFCPVYQVKVEADGAISFTGERHTAELGVRERRADARTFQSLSSELAPYRPDVGMIVNVDCAAAISDTPTYTITWTYPDGRTGVARHQGGCPSGAGHELDLVLRRVPAQLGIEAWSRQTTRPGVSRG